MPIHRRRLSFAAGYCFASLLGSAAAFAGPPAPTAFFPTGGGRGQTVAVAAEGKFDAWPVKAWSSDSHLVVEPAEKKGAFAVRIAGDCPPGLHWIRLYDDSGASSLLPFEVGTLPAIVESEPNDDPASAGKLDPFPAVIDGRLAKSGDVDGYAVPLSKGQTLVASLAGHRLGSPMDAVLQVASPAGFVLQQNDDEAGLDPLLVFEAPADGVYVVRCFAFPAEPNSTIGFAGGDRYLYRLTLTTGGFLDHPQPLAVEKLDSEVHAIGWNLPDEATALTVGASASVDRVRVWHPNLAGHAELPVLPFRCLVAADGGASGEVQTLTPPVAVTGGLSIDGDRDRYRFTAKKDETWTFRLHAGSLGSRLNPVLKIADPAGKTLIEKDATGKGGRDVEHRLTVPKDGDYAVAVFDLAERGGPRRFYRLDISKPVPDYRLTLAADRCTVAPDKPAVIEVTLVREGGFTEPIDVTIAGLPDGVEVPPVRDEPKPDAKPDDGMLRTTLKLTLTATEGAAAFSGPITVVGRGTPADAGPERTATVALSIPGATTNQVWLTVVPAVK